MDLLRSDVTYWSSYSGSGLIDGSCSAGSNEVVGVGVYLGWHPRLTRRLSPPVTMSMLALPVSSPSRRTVPAEVGAHDGVDHRPAWRSCAGI